MLTNSVARPSTDLRIDLTNSHGPDKLANRFHVSRSFGHQPALDGLRGLAVGTVLLFHAGIGWMAGGFHGIDVFFVLSGYLITTLLLGEANADGSISLRQFWVRRIRRLFPALALVLCAVVLYAWLVAAPNEGGRIRRDGIGTLFYVANWLQITDQVGYFDRFATPSPLLHTWSLAVEEQYYLLWPVVVAIAARLILRQDPWENDRKRLRRQRILRRRIGTIAVLGAVASVATMVFLSVRGASVGRIYFGTDTRGHALLIGSALAAFGWGRWSQPEGNVAAPAPLGFRVAGIGGAVVVTAASVHHWSDTLLQRGGFTLVALATAGVIALAVHPGGGSFSAALSWAPLRWLGRISYGAYLWHWPIYVVLSPQRVALPSWLLTVLRLAVTLVAAMVSYVLVEEPLRRRVRWRVSLMPLSMAVLALLLLVSTSGAVPTDSERFEQEQIDNAAPPTLPPTTAPPPPPPRTTVLVVGDALGASVAGDWVTEGEVDIVNRTWPECSIAKPAGCGDWRSEWPAALQEVRPDVMVVIARSWHPISRNPELWVDYDLDIAKPTNVLLDDLQSVLQITRPVATLAFATVPLDSLTVRERQTAKMFEGVVDQLGKADPTVMVTRMTGGVTRGPAGSVVDPAHVTQVRADLAFQLRMAHLARLAGVDTTVGLTKVLVVGDSVGWSLGSYWYGQDGIPPPEDPLRLWNRAQFFCELASGPRIERNGTVGLSDRCRNWREQWSRYVEEFDPDVVLLMVGSWEVFDRRIDGRRLRFATPEHDAYLTGLLQEAVDRLSARGARVVVATQPVPVSEPDPGRPREWWDKPADRFDHLNALLRSLAAANPTTTQLIDLAARVCPTAPCPKKIDGVTPRPDGVHYGAAGGRWVAEWLTPQLVAAGAEQPE
jgi:peptidoglycan/LPS O-acetylase OafA/YrhL/lysophospholipase L1-like esterase